MKILLLLFSFYIFVNAQEAVKKVVFDLTTSDIKTFEKKVLSGIVNQKTHYENKLEELEVAVIIHGDAYKFFIKDLSISAFKNESELVKEQNDLSKRIHTMSDTYNVEFFICEAGMKNLKISKENIYKFLKIVPNATIGLIDKQQDGYAYIPIR